MKKVNKERLDRNLEFLNEVYETTNKGFIDLNQRYLRIKYRLGAKTFNVLDKIGWIEKKGNKRATLYRWKVGKPNHKTAMLFIEKSSIINKEYGQELNNKVKENLNQKEVIKEEVKIKEDKIVNNKEISLMWGLIKIKF